MEVFAQVNAAHVGVGHDFGGRARRQHAAFADDDGVVANAQRFAHAVVGNQHADALLFQEGDDALDFDDGDGVDARKWLVQQDEARLRGQGAGDFHAPPLAAGKRGRGRIAQVGHGELLQQIVQAPLDLARGQRAAIRAALQLQHGAHVFGHRQPPEDGCFLRQVGKPQARALVDGHFFDGAAIDGDAARIGPQQADDHVERRGLARAIGAEQADHFTAAHGERNVLHHAARAVVLAQIAHLQRAGGGGGFGGFSGPGGRCDGNGFAHGFFERLELPRSAAGAAGWAGAPRGPSVARMRSPRPALLCCGTPSTV